MSIFLKYLIDRLRSALVQNLQRKVMDCVYGRIIGRNSLFTKEASESFFVFPIRNYLHFSPLSYTSIYIFTYDFTEKRYWLRCIFPCSD